MSLEYNLALLTNPINFTKNHILFCEEDPGCHYKVREYYLSVSSADRACYWDIEEEGDNPIDNRCLVKISRNKVEDFSCGFYLPFKFDHVIKCTLKDKRDLVSSTQVDEPKAFFTYVISGCSIIIEGPPENPTVYHANNSVGPPTEFKLEPHEIREFVARDLTEKWQKSSPTHYVSNIWKTSKKSQVVIPGKALHGMDYLPVPPKIYKQYVHNYPEIRGMVFGVKSDGVWTFYLQKILQLTCMQEPNRGKWTYKNLGVQKFWPGGQLGRVVLRPPFLTHKGEVERLGFDPYKIIGGKNVFKSITEEML